MENREENKKKEVSVIVGLHKTSNTYRILEGIKSQNWASQTFEERMDKNF